MLDEDRVRISHMLDAASAKAAAKVSAETRELSPTIPWAQIVSMRHRLVHGYFDVEPDIVWRTATEEVPALIPQLRDLDAAR